MPVSDKNRVWTRLWVGSRPYAAEVPRLRAEGFTAVTLCAKEHQPVLPGMLVVRVFLDDKRCDPCEGEGCAACLLTGTVPPSPEEIAEAERAALDVASLHRTGRRVLVTCYAGLNRSGLVAALAIRQITGCPGEAALTRVQLDREGALSNSHFAAYLRSLPALDPRVIAERVLLLLVFARYNRVALEDAPPNNLGGRHRALVTPGTLHDFVRLGGPLRRRFLGPRERAVVPVAGEALGEGDPLRGFRALGRFFRGVGSHEGSVARLFFLYRLARSAAHRLQRPSDPRFFGVSACPFTHVPVSFAASVERKTGFPSRRRLLRWEALFWAFTRCLSCMTCDEDGARSRLTLQGL